MTRSSVAGYITHGVVYGIGIGVGILISRRYYRLKYERIVAEERALAAHYKQIKEKKREKAKTKSKPEVVEESLTVFLEDDNPYNLNWNATELDYEAEKKHRSDEAPYVISKDEYDYDKPQFGKIDLEYYKDEDVLLDDRVDPMTSVDEIVGDENLKRFGHGSGDRRMVYIRNEELETDFSVRLMMGSYAVDVLGLDDPHDEGKRWKPPH